MKEALFEQYLAKSVKFSQYKPKRPHALCMCLICLVLDSLESETDL